MSLNFCQQKDDILLSVIRKVKKSTTSQNYFSLSLIKIKLMNPLLNLIFWMIENSEIFYDNF